MTKKDLEWTLEMAAGFMAGLDTCARCPLYLNGVYCPIGIGQNNKCTQAIAAHFIAKAQKEGR